MSFTYYDGLFWISLAVAIAVTYFALGGHGEAKCLLFRIYECKVYAKLSKNNLENGDATNQIDLELFPNIKSNSSVRIFNVNVYRLSLLQQLQLKYLAVYGFMVAGDWLQGPYVYVLYESYGWDREIIAVLFVIGFGSSMILGTFIGALADQYGRKRFCLVYVVLYIVSCLTKHSRNFWMLSVGRLTGGAATSLLMSVFESWYVCEYHHIRESCRVEVNNQSEGGSLEQTLSLASLLNFMVAVLAGVVAEGIVNAFPYNSDPQTSSSTWFYGGYTAPFDLAILSLGVGTCLLCVLWSENYGKRNSQSPSGFFDVVREVLSNRLILCLGLTQACFEGAMYCFIFLWTPALRTKKGGEHPPLGKIFSTFMVCSMVGSQLFSICVRYGIPEHKILFLTLLVAAFSLGIGSLDDLVGRKLIYLGFLAFEVCIGLYYPAMGTLRSKYVPDDNRSTIYNISRIPLNAVVLIVLLGNFTLRSSWLLCALLLFTSVVLHGAVIKIIPATTGNASGLSTGNRI